MNISAPNIYEEELELWKNMVKYEAIGGDVQYLKATLQDGESAFIEPGHLIHKSSDVHMDVQAGGLHGALSHMLSGSAVFLLKVNGPGVFTAAGFLPGKIVEVKLNGNSILAEFNAFLSMDSGIDYSRKFAGIWTGMMGGEGVFLEKFTGNGSIFLHSHGQPLELNLQPGEQIQVEMSHVLAFEESVQYNVQRIGGLKTMLLAGAEGEGLFFANMKGPGKVWVHTISLYQLALKMIRRQ